MTAGLVRSCESCCSTYVSCDSITFHPFVVFNIVLIMQARNNGLSPTTTTDIADLQNLKRFWPLITCGAVGLNRPWCFLGMSTPKLEDQKINPWDAPKKRLLSDSMHWIPHSIQISIAKLWGFHRIGILWEFDEISRKLWPVAI